MQEVLFQKKKKKAKTALRVSVRSHPGYRESSQSQNPMPSDHPELQSQCHVCFTENAWNSDMYSQDSPLSNSGKEQSAMECQLKRLPNL